MADHFRTATGVIVQTSTKAATAVGFTPVVGQKPAKKATKKPAKSAEKKE